MNIKEYFKISKTYYLNDLSLLFIRVVCGSAFVLHGLPKIQNPFSWMGDNSFAPAIFLALAALAEFGGGIALILGLLSPLACLGIASTMIVAVYFHLIIKGDPFVSAPSESSYELALVYLSVAFIILVAGPGKFSLDYLIFGQKNQNK